MANHVSEKKLRYVVGMRCTQQEKNALADLASKRGTTASELLREAANAQGLFALTEKQEGK